MDNEKKKITHEEKPMTLREYIAELRKLSRKYGDLPVYYSKDDFGNGYNPVTHIPELGTTNGVPDYENRGFHPYRPEQPDYGCDKEDINAVCVN